MSSFQNRLVLARLLLMLALGLILSAHLVPIEFPFNPDEEIANPGYSLTEGWREFLDDPNVPKTSPHGGWEFYAMLGAEIVLLAILPWVAGLLSRSPALRGSVAVVMAGCSGWLVMQFTGIPITRSLAGPLLLIMGATLGFTGVVAIPRAGPMEPCGWRPVALLAAAFTLVPASPRLWTAWMLHRCHLQLVRLERAIRAYEATAGNFPDTMLDLVKRPDLLPRAIPWQQQLAEIPADPWGGTWSYRVGTEPYDLGHAYLLSPGPNRLYGVQDHIMLEMFPLKSGHGAVYSPSDCF